MDISSLEGVWINLALYKYFIYIIVSILFKKVWLFGFIVTTKAYNTYNTSVDCIYLV